MKVRHNFHQLLVALIESFLVVIVGVLVIFLAQLLWQPVTWDMVYRHLGVILLGTVFGTLLNLFLSIVFKQT